MDARWIKFRSEYTLQEHAMDAVDSVNRGNRELGGIRSELAASSEARGREARAVSEGLWATESALYGVQDEIAGLRDDLRNGFMGMAKLFDWGISRLCWEHEQDRQVYRELLDVLKHPLRTQGEEHWEIACRDMRNERWPEAADELKETLSDDRRHYLAHFHLGHIIFFRQELSDPAIEHFELAARYADEVGASDSQQHWAALAYAHMALLYRLYGETSESERQQWLEKAKEAAMRALQLVPTLPPAVHEAILTHILLGDEAAVQEVMEDAARQDEALLLGIERNPQLMGEGAVQGFVANWHDRGRPIAAGLSELAREAEELLDQLQPANDIIREPVPGALPPVRDLQPRAALVAEARRIGDVLTCCLEIDASRLRPAQAEAATTRTRAAVAQRSLENGVARRREVEAMPLKREGLLEWLGFTGRKQAEKDAKLRDLDGHIRAASAAAVSATESAKQAEGNLQRMSRASSSLQNATSLLEGRRKRLSDQIAHAYGSGVEPSSPCHCLCAGEKITGPDGSSMVWVPPGEFIMGNGAKDTIRHSVRITKGFWIGEHPVTNRQYRVFCSAGGRRFPHESDQGDDHPVVSVDWDDAQAYCRYYGLALPTEAEWEYAARGPENRLLQWGQGGDSEMRFQCCNSMNRGPGGKTFPTGSFPHTSSWCGAQDMAGNVWEWCWDWYAAGYYRQSPIDDPPGPATGSQRVRRGGSWGAYPVYCSPANRYDGGNESPACNGFRVASPGTVGRLRRWPRSNS